MPKAPRSSKAKESATEAPAEAAVRNSMTIDQIVQTSVQLIQKEGLAGLSMRQLAGLLEVTPTAIYHHVRDKDALLDLCAEHILEQIPNPDESLDWPQRLRQLILAQQRVFMRFPGLARFLLIHRESSVASLQWAESILRVLDAAGYSGQPAMRVLIALSFLVNPITLIDDKVHTRKVNPVLSRARVASVVKKNPGKFRCIVDVMPYLDGNSYETHFEIALDRVIAGIERELSQVSA